MSLRTPEMIRTLQRKLYIAAKEEPERRFHQLYDKIHRADILTYAYRLARSRKGAPGVDGVTFAQIEAQGLGDWLEGLGKELREKTYRPQPVRRVMIPKANGGERPLGIPTIRDRVVQTAAKLVMEPIFEADFEDCAYGYRPKRSAQDAVNAVHKALCEGYTDVVDADLSKFFDRIPHAELMQSVARRVVDHQMLKLIKTWLKVPTQVTEANGRTRMEGGRRSTHGTPQGGVASPLLANIYMHRYLKHWRQQGMGDVFRARIVNYADDFVILSRDKAAEALEWTRGVMRAIGLTLNEQKTCLRNARQESFDFLGYTFGPERFRKNGQWYLAAQPSKRSVKRVKGRVRELLRPGNMGAWPQVVGDLNRILRGWATYFRCGTRYFAYRAVDRHVQERVRNFLRRRHKVSRRGARRFSYEAVWGRLGVYRLLGPLG